ncbi:proteophosphoglycan ppg4 [Neofusicoccum parvum]|uniref:Proteophosphoglycan ppg4 n=1 Tax=Neofusicoccum parvum TaxID=310453 RepID=A0ACB5SPL7_9PEZI|nr:proteophosphoglycan ppg4 [Neofusicoccum parvum]
MLFARSTLAALAVSLSFSVTDAAVADRRSPQAEGQRRGFLDYFNFFGKRQQSDACVPSNDYYQILSSHTSAAELCATLIGRPTETINVVVTPISTVTQLTSTRVATVHNLVSVTSTSTSTVTPASLAARAPEPTAAPDLSKRAANKEAINNFIRQLEESSSFDSTATALQSISSGLSSACDCLGHDHNPSVCEDDTDLKQNSNCYLKRSITNSTATVSPGSISGSLLRIGVFNDTNTPPLTSAASDLTLTSTSVALSTTTAIPQCGDNETTSSASSTYFSTEYTDAGGTVHMYWTSQYEYEAANRQVCTYNNTQVFTSTNVITIPATTYVSTVTTTGSGTGVRTVTSGNIVIVEASGSAEIAPGATVTTTGLATSTSTGATVLIPTTTTAVVGTFNTTIVSGGTTLVELFTYSSTSVSLLTIISETSTSNATGGSGISAPESTATATGGSTELNGIGFHWHFSPDGRLQRVSCQRKFDCNRRFQRVCTKQLHDDDYDHRHFSII